MRQGINHFTQARKIYQAAIEISKRSADTIFLYYSFADFELKEGNIDKCKRILIEYTGRGDANLAVVEYRKLITKFAEIDQKSYSTALERLLFHYCSVAMLIALEHGLDTSLDYLNNVAAGKDTSSVKEGNVLHVMLHQQRIRIIHVYSVAQKTHNPPLMKQLAQASLAIYPSNSFLLSIRYAQTTRIEAMHLQLVDETTYLFKVWKDPSIATSTLAQATVDFPTLSLWLIYLEHSPTESLLGVYFPAIQVHGYSKILGMFYYKQAERGVDIYEWMQQQEFRIHHSLEQI